MLFHDFWWTENFYNKSKINDGREFEDLPSLSDKEELIQVQQGDDNKRSKIQDLQDNMINISFKYLNAFGLLIFYIRTQKY